VPTLSLSATNRRSQANSALSESILRSRGTFGRSKCKCAFPVVRSVKLQGLLEELVHTASFLPPVLDYNAWLKRPPCFDSAQQSNGFIATEVTVTKKDDKLLQTSTNGEPVSLDSVATSNTQTSNPNCRKLIYWSLFIVIVLLSVLAFSFKMLFDTPLRVGGLGAFNHILSFNVELRRDFERELPA